MPGFKVPVIGAVIAFVLSLVIGLIAGNGATALLRSLCAAVVCFLVFFGLAYLAKRFLPELFDNSGFIPELDPDASTDAVPAAEAAPAVEAVSDPAVGKNVDISVEDPPQAPKETAPPLASPVPAAAIPADQGLDQTPESNYNSSSESISGRQDLPSQGFVPMSFENDTEKANPALEHSPQDMAKAIQTELRHDKG
jgi:hypothetical protein